MLVQFNPSTWYRLHNAYLGPSTTLDVVNNAGLQSRGTLQMATLGHYSGQFWHILPHPSLDGTYTLSTRFLGPAKCLSISPDGVTARLGDGEGSRWRIVPWFEESEDDVLRLKWDGTYKIVLAEEQAWSEGEVCLDTYSDTKELFVGEGSHSGKHWSLTPIESIRARDLSRE